MTTPYIEAAPLTFFNVDDDVFWIITKDSDGDVSQAMFYDLEDAKEYLHKVKGIPLEEIKIVMGEE